VESPSDLLEDILASWTGRLEGVFGQEVARARELTVWAKEALRLNETGDEERKEEILESWRRQMEGVMEFTGDLVDCVNNDTKEIMVEGLGSASTPPPMETSLIIEEKEEDEEKEEEIMKLFWTPCIFPSSGNFPKSVMRSHKRKDNTKKKDLERKQIKIAGETPRKKNNNADVSNGFHIHQGLKMFRSTLDPEDIFDDWNWNLLEFEEFEDIFAEWRWNMETKVDLKLKFYDDPTNDKLFNDFHFWNIGHQSTVSEAMARTLLCSDDIESCISPDSGCFFLKTEEERNKVSVDTWMECKYWEQSFHNHNILHSLLDDEIQDSDSISVHTVNFWDESANNQAVVELQLVQEINGKEEYLWEDKDIIFALVLKEPKVQQCSQYFPWEDPDTMAGLMEDHRCVRRMSGDSTFLWDDPAAIGLLLTDEEDDTYLPWDDNKDMTEELSSFTPEVGSDLTWDWRERDTQGYSLEQHTVETREEDCTVWDQYYNNNMIQLNQQTSLHQASHKSKNELDLNIEEPFWNMLMKGINVGITKISQETTSLPLWSRLSVCQDVQNNEAPKLCLKKTRHQPRDPANTFKDYRYIFKEADQVMFQTKTKRFHENKLFEDMLDIYSDWAPNVLADDRIEKKRQKRGSAATRSHRMSAGGEKIQHGKSNNITVKRPTTSTIVIKNTKSCQFDSSWIQTNIKRKDRTNWEVS